MDHSETSETLSVKDADTAERQERALACLRAGGKLGEAAKAAGVAERTLYTWRAENPEFRQAVDNARTAGKALRVMVARDKVFEAAKKGVLQACFYIIEHDDPEATPSVDNQLTIKVVRERANGTTHIAGTVPGATGD